MDANLVTVALAAGGATVGVVAALKAKARLDLSRAKHRSLAGHARWSRRIAALVPAYEFGPDRFFDADGAPPDVAERRRAGFARLAARFRQSSPQTRRAGLDAADTVSDVQFTSRYRVPFPFSRLVREELGAGSFLASSAGVMVTDLDGNAFYDLTGSYGVNLLGTDVYKACIEEGAAAARELGPILGSYHPQLNEVAVALRRISGLDEVSFHMSGTEAVMQAVRLARYHTGRRRLVRFCGAYHGWWGDVQPGIGNPMAAPDTLTLAEMSERTLRLLSSRRDVACVLVNPLQALHPNVGAPADSSLVGSRRRAGFDREAYTAWLRALRDVCSARGIVLVFDEVFVGFRLARGGAQEYFGVRADLVTYGKTLGGGLPVGVICGRSDLMRRYNPDRPADICFARGTFNAHPYVIAAMAAFLRRFDGPEVRALYDGLDATWDGRAARLNERLAAEGLPVRVANLSTIWTVLHDRPSRYNWMLQYYLRAEGLALSWIGTGRLIFSLNYDEAAFEAVADRFVAAARAMERDGWWTPELSSDKAIARQILREMLDARLGRISRAPKPELAPAE